MNRKTVLCSIIAALMLAGCSAGGEDNTQTDAQLPEVTASAAADTADDEDAGDNSDVQETEQAEEAQAESLCSEIIGKIQESVEMSTMAEVGRDRVPMYLDCTIPTDCDFAMIFCGSGGFADEVCVVKIADLDADAFYAAVEKRIESRVSDFADYNPDEAQKVADYFSETLNGYYIYAITPDNDKAAEIFESFVK